MSRYILPGILFVLIVGAIAWVTQFMPNWRTQTIGPAPDPSEKAVIRFPWSKTKWDKNDEDYALELETGADGHYDFPYENVTDQPAELGLTRTSCDCTSLEVCTAPQSEWERYVNEIAENPLTAKAGAWTWQKVVPSETKGFEVPPRARGFVRVAWQGRKAAGSRLTLDAYMWDQPHGNLSQRHFERLQVTTVIAAPVRATPQRINVGTLGPRDSAVAEFVIWSATRDSLDLLGYEAKNPDFGASVLALLASPLGHGPLLASEALEGGGQDALFTYRLRPYSADECRNLEKSLRKSDDKDKPGENTRVRVAYALHVTVNEEAAGKHLDQGAFFHDVSFMLDDKDIRGPQVFGTVKGDVIVGSSEERGKVNLSIFKAKFGTKKIITLWAPESTTLEPEDPIPRTLDVKLTKGEKSGGQVKWLLEVNVPGGIQYGPFPEESAVILRTQAKPPRFLRIPVTGNGQS